ncbi:MAG: ThuA domain-containing protein [Planctomycetaceae bacterium]|jgi:type 1 glutamine amidotransferase|nr:ThuA domain-containing protein [Planctomycetaceae bacterium]
MKLQKILVAIIFATGLPFAANLSAQNVSEKQLPKIKTLIIDGDNNHNWKGTTPVLRKILEDSGRFAVDVITLTKEKEKNNFNVSAVTKNLDKELVGNEFSPIFDKFDLVVSNFNNHKGGNWSEATKAAFEKYIKDGRGFVIYHAADNAFRDWKEYNKMIAIGGWGGRNESDGPYLYIDDNDKIIRDDSKGSGGNHGKQWAFTITNQTPEHPIMKNLPKQFKHSNDELYDRMRGPAENVTILATAYAKDTTKRHEPMLLAIDYGKGRIFHTTLGHDTGQLKSVAFIVTFLRGAEWAATGKVTIPVPDDMPNESEPKVR